jgi:hypothetical protein
VQIKKGNFIMTCSWKKDWEKTKDNFNRWWHQDGLLVSSGFVAPQAALPHEAVEKPPAKSEREAEYTDIDWRANYHHYQMANSAFYLDTLPIIYADYGPGSLAMFLGSKPGFEKDTIWFYPTMQDELEPEKLAPLTFDANNDWFKIITATLQKNVDMGRGKYLTACPDLVENLDILASLRDAQTLLMDMIERPDWVKEKVFEINQVWIEAYSRIYDIIKDEDGSSAFWAFGLWAPGTTAKVQCDASSMFSPEMFKEFAVPVLTEQCEWLDYSMFHLDGHQCICHLDHLLEIDALDAIEWTPDPMVPSGGSSEWYPMYKRILEAGKSIQAIEVKHDEIKPLLDAIGPKGVYIFTNIANEADAEKVAKIVEPYR